MDGDPLFRPFKLKQMELQNRLVMAPMTRRFSPDGIPTAEVASYYRLRAEGGVGLIITEGTTIGRPAASNDSRIPNFHEQASLDAWRHVVAEVHSAGAQIAPQLWHQGIARAPGSGPHPEAASEGASGTDPGTHTMTDADISDTIDAFAQAAAAAKAVGFDAVELHGAHGYLIDQFLWSKSNQRSDRYNGSTATRTRFAVEIIKAVRLAVGPEFPLIFRFSQWKMQDYDAKLADSPDALLRLLAPLREAGVDIFHASTRRFWVPEFEGSSLNLAGWTKKLTGSPTISVGSVGLDGPDFTEQLRGQSQGASVGSLDELRKRMNAKEFDLVAIGRALIADPNWPIKVSEGRLADVHAFEKRQLASLAPS